MQSPETSHPSFNDSALAQVENADAGEAVIVSRLKESLALVLPLNSEKFKTLEQEIKTIIEDFLSCRSDVNHDMVRAHETVIPVYVAGGRNLATLINDMKDFLNKESAEDLVNRIWDHLLARQDYYWDLNQEQEPNNIVMNGSTSATGFEFVPCSESGRPKKTCKADDCTRLVDDAKMQYYKSSLCKEHITALTFTYKHIQQRYCWKCKKPHPVEQFPGNKKRCEDNRSKRNGGNKPFLLKD